MPLPPGSDHNRPMETTMADNLVPFPRRCANENSDDVPPFDPANPVHVRAWRTLYEIARSELRWRWLEEEAR